MGTTSIAYAAPAPRPATGRGFEHWVPVTAAQGLLASLPTPFAVPPLPSTAGHWHSDILKAMRSQRVDRSAGVGP